LQLRIDKNLTQNLIPKLSKGSDIVIMEAIERELLDNDDFEFDKEAE
jgi:predicted DNA-binding protein